MSFVIGGRGLAFGKEAQLGRWEAHDVQHPRSQVVNGVGSLGFMHRILTRRLFEWCDCWRRLVLPPWRGQRRTSRLPLAVLVDILPISKRRSFPRVLDMTIERSYSRCWRVFWLCPALAFIICTLPPLVRVLWDERDLSLAGTADKSLARLVPSARVEWDIEACTDMYRVGWPEFVGLAQGGHLPSAYVYMPQDGNAARLTSIPYSRAIPASDSFGLTWHISFFSRCG